MTDAPRIQLLLTGDELAFSNSGFTAPLLTTPLLTAPLLTALPYGLTQKNRSSSTLRQLLATQQRCKP